MGIMGDFFGGKEGPAKPADRNESEIENRKQDLRNLYAQLYKANTEADDAEKLRINDLITKTKEDLVDLGLSESEIEDFLARELGIAA